MQEVHNRFHPRTIRVWLLNLEDFLLSFQDCLWLVQLGLTLLPLLNSFLFGGEGSRTGRSGRSRVTVQPRKLPPTWTETAQRSRQQDPEITEWTSLGSEENSKGRCSSESHWTIQSCVYKQGSVSKDAMSRGDNCLWNSLIFILSDVVTFYTLKAGLHFIFFFF